MGITSINGTVIGPEGSFDLEFLVDSGAMYTVLPHEVWKTIGLNPRRRESFRLADGTLVQRNVSQCDIRLDVGEAASPGILGEPGDAALLGVVTLGNLGVVFNPFSRTLHPMQLLL